MSPKEPFEWNVALQLKFEESKARIVEAIKEGLKIYGDKTLTVLLKEFGKLHKYDMLDPQIMENLSFEKRKEALNIITMVEEKRDGTIKTRACADGRDQRRYIPKEEGASPTI